MDEPGDQRLRGFPAPERVPEPDLDALPWGWTTPVVRAGGHALRVRTTSAELGRHVQGLLSGFPPAQEPPACTYRLVEGVNGSPVWWAVYADEVRISNVGSVSAALTHLFAHVNRAVAAAAPADAVPLHAAACALEGRAVLLLGPTESGKSTLAAALGRAGLTYLTDEVAVVDAAGREVAPYAKPLSIDPGAWGVLPELAPAGPPTVADTQWHVAPSRLRGGTASGPVPVHAVVLCRWRPDGATSLVPARPADAVVSAALDMFRPRDRLLHQVRVLAGLVERAGAHRLEHSRTEEAVGAVVGLLRTG